LSYEEIPSLNLIACFLLCAAQQHPPSVAEGDTLIIRLLNGKTGKPVKNSVINVWLEDAQIAALNPTTDSNGEIHLRIADAQSRTLRFLPGDSVDCRYKKGQLFEPVKFPIQEILSHGVVAPNLCGNATAKPTPGVLVIFVRNLTFMEKWRL
jgi:hypothetical protein